jgi:hypothetical protein
MTDSVCLVVFLTYNYGSNLPKIYKYYGDMFEKIKIIIPYYHSSDDDRVITVYENCWNYQGMFAQAYPRLMEENFSHYIFVADDCIINNRLNEHNILTSLNLDQRSSFITELQTLASRSLNWLNFSEENTGFRTYGVEYKAEIPEPTEAVKLYQRHKNFINFSGSSFTNYKVLSWPGSVLFRLYRKAWRVIKNNRRLTVSHKYFPKIVKHLPYPLLMGYSDFLVVNSYDLPYFCHLCGVFASMRMFVEIAIPTALAMASSHIVTLNDTDFTAKTFWGAERLTNLVTIKNNCQGLVNNLFSGDGKKVLYFHPIKLSSWMVELIN